MHVVDMLFIAMSKRHFQNRVAPVVLVLVKHNNPGVCRTLIGLIRNVSSVYFVHQTCILFDCYTGCINHNSSKMYYASTEKFRIHKKLFFFFFLSYIFP